MEALRVYASISYRVDIELITPLFTELEEPTVEEPRDPEVTVTNDKGS